MERIIELKQAANVRDLGGYQTKDGREIDFKKLLRGASLAELSSTDQAKLAEYGVVQVVDFRSPEEEQQAPDKVITGAKNIFLPVFATDETEASIAPTELFQQLEKGFSAAEQMQKVYRHFVESASARKAYQHFFELLLANEAPAKSTLFHCTAGKDRTGFAAALFLAALEVNQADIMANYLETNRYLSQKVTDMKAQAEAKGAPASLIKEIEQLMRADESYLAASYRSIEDNYGDMVGFLKDGLMLSNQDLVDLASLYTKK